MQHNLNVYTIHDDPSHGQQDAEDRWWAAIVAETEHHAIVIASVIYDGEAPRDEWDWREAFEIAATISPSDWPERLRPQYPQQIRDPEALRLCRFREPGEPECEACGLPACGIKKYAVCEDCYVCLDCGCQCEAVQTECDIRKIRDHFVDVRNAMDEVLDTLRAKIRDWPN